MGNLYADYKCIQCLLRRYADIDSSRASDKDKTLYMKELLKIISDAPPTMRAPEIIEKITNLQGKYNIETVDYTAIKKRYNALLLSLADELWKQIKEDENSLYLAMCYAFTGNYIDFGALSDITEEKLGMLLKNAKNVSFDKNEFLQFEKELSVSKNLVYLTDNCGEIVLDMLFIKLIKEKFPELNISVIVRGKNVLNDATMDDVHQIGLDKIAYVTHNGSGIAGTVLGKISEEASMLINKADIIISKGMGNFETISGAGLNIYYMFLCKCEKFCKEFNAPKLSYMFLNDRRMNEK